MARLKVSKVTEYGTIKHLGAGAAVSKAQSATPHQAITTPEDQHIKA